MTLYNHVILSHGPAEARALSAALERLRLPMPEAHEFIETSDQGYMVFLEPFGATLRLIADEAFPSFKSDHILQPIGTIALERFRLDIKPGVATAINEDDTDELVDLLRYENIDYFDNGTANVGWLSYVSRDFPDGYPVVIDIGAVKKLTLGAHYAGKIVRYKKIQDQLFGDLKSSFSNALHASSASSMTDFWAACKNKADNGFLQASWTWKEARNIRGVSENYAERLKLHAPFADIL